MSIFNNETKDDSSKNNNDEPECDVLKEFIAKYNESLEENIKLKDEVFRLQKENVDLMDMISYRDQMNAHSTISTSTQIMTLADELRIETNLETEQVSHRLPFSSSSPIDLPSNAGSLAQEVQSVAEKSLKQVKCLEDKSTFCQKNSETKIETEQLSNEKPISSSSPIDAPPKVDNLVLELQNEVEKSKKQIKCLKDEVTFYQQNIEKIKEEHEQMIKDLVKYENAPKKETFSWFDEIASFWFISRKKRVYFVFFICFALVWKGFTIFNSVAALQSKILPYYTFQEITADIINHIYFIT